MRALGRRRDGQALQEKPAYDEDRLQITVKGEEEMTDDPQTTENWPLLMKRVRQVRKNLYFSRRLKFDLEVRPILECGTRIEYPDAIYHITAEDVRRAEAAVGYDGARDARA